MAAGRILIIEDNVDNLELVRFLLERSHYEVLPAFDGLDGLVAARKEKPDLILLDLSLPGMDGWSVASTLKADPETAFIPVVALTAHSLPSDRRRALESGCDGYLSKPLDIPNFILQVAAFIANHSTGQKIS
jgi:two-component system, cell cycle response regulator DivK